MPVPRYISGDGYRLDIPASGMHKRQKANFFPIAGTLKDPIMVKSFGDEQYCGCTGFPADSHVTKWLTVGSIVTS